MIRPVSLAVALLALAGCASQQRQVLTPLPVACDVQTPARPAMPLEGLAAPYTVDQWISNAIAEVKVREAFEREIMVVLWGCTKPLE